MISVYAATTPLTNCSLAAVGRRMCSIFIAWVIYTDFFSPGIFMMRAHQISSWELRPTLSLATPRTFLLSTVTQNNISHFFCGATVHFFVHFTVQVPGRRGIWAELQWLQQRGFCQVFEEAAARRWEDHCGAGQSCRGCKIMTMMNDNVPAFTVSYPIKLPVL